METVATDKMRAYLVGIRWPGMSAAEANEHLDELAQLASTYGVAVVGGEVTPIREPSPRHLLGSGKVEELKVACQAADAELLIFDDELSPSQQRNWERDTKLTVIDRHEVILGIFADRAQTKEARLQVELARAEYLLPRLTKAWSHLERQRGGRGLRGGAGEAQLEIDRRLVRTQIERLKKDLKHVRQVRSTQRKTRMDVPMTTVALVGYTNAGKSSLLNALTGARVLEEDKLFATLDPTTRKYVLPNRQQVLLTDTVGFVRKLPHSLVEAFKATLEEAVLANVVVHVVDASHPQAEEHMRATETVLHDLGIDIGPGLPATPPHAHPGDYSLTPRHPLYEMQSRKPLTGPSDRSAILVLNKVDLVQDRLSLAKLATGYVHVVQTSTLTKEGLEALGTAVSVTVASRTATVTLAIPASRSDLMALLHREGCISEAHYHDDGTALVTARIPPRLMANVIEFRTESEPQ